MAKNTKHITKRPMYSTMNGILYPTAFSPKCFKEALEYKHRPNDVFIVTYPRCGTTWMQNVALYIFRKGKELENMSTFLKHCPFIDMFGKESIDKMPQPGGIKTHIPYTHLLRSPRAKYVFVTRNPKDCLVSLYHHSKNMPILGYWDGQFDDFFELFMAGEVEYNGYFDHLLSWYPHRNDPNVFYTTYEEMKKDIRNVIVKLATFLGDEFIDAIEKDNSVLNNIVLYSGFEYMQKHLSKAYDLTPKKGEAPMEPLTYEGAQYSTEFVQKLDLPDKLPEMKFIRKGIVGDWKNALTEEQSERLNEKFLEKTKGTDIHNWFKLI